MATARPSAVHGAEVAPGGRCAVLRVNGDPDPAARILCRDWLPASGETLRNVPCYCDRPAHEAVADLFLPLA
ncbi:hypothetical protein [Poseidonocella sp. HB161398]|uniref:hypothetical protein n=1 Tax=Poseidonocella sp. HB161398 TaxID=2320855 RepID=UPI00197F400C|nr:hypothetical protein [Poseidonocella sp. HB161398]